MAYEVSYNGEVPFPVPVAARYDGWNLQIFPLQGDNRVINTILKHDELMMRTLVAIRYQDALRVTIGYQELIDDEDISDIVATGYDQKEMPSLIMPSSFGYYAQLQQPLSEFLREPYEGLENMPTPPLSDKIEVVVQYVMRDGNATAALGFPIIPGSF